SWCSSSWANATSSKASRRPASRAERRGAIETSPAAEGRRGFFIMAKLKKKVTFALLGLGTVGTGVAELLEKNRQLIESRVGASVELKAALVRDIKRARPGVPASVKIYTDIDPILKDPEIDIVVEVMGGYEPA